MPIPPVVARESRRLQAAFVEEHDTQVDVPGLSVCAGVPQPGPEIRVPMGEIELREPVISGAASVTCPWEVRVSGVPDQQMPDTAIVDFVCRHGVQVRAIVFGFLAWEWLPRSKDHKRFSIAHQVTRISRVHGQRIGDNRQRLLSYPWNEHTDRDEK